MIRHGQPAIRLGKYVTTGQVTWQNQLAYVSDQFGRAIFLAVVMYVFVALWRATYASTGHTIIAGLSLPAMIWYLAITESIHMASPRVDARLGEEVRSGGLAYSLNKPYNFLGFQYAVFVGEFAFAFLVCLAVAAAVCFATVGPFAYDWTMLPVHVVSIALAITANFLLSAVIGLLAFWVEDVYGISLLVSRMQMILGGLMLPLDLFPAWLQRVAAWLPFQATIGDPARLIAGVPGATAAAVLGRQSVWIAALLLLATIVYRQGVRRVNVNGG